LYGGPQIVYVRRGFDPLPMPHRNHQLALAQLGYVVVVVDGRGTPGRSKAFHDAAAGDWQVVADDQAAALRNLAAQRPYLDLSRAGVYGHSWGGGNAFRAIAAYPELYRAAVISGPGLDCRTILCEPYMGLMPEAAAVYERQSLYRLAPRIRGALMLIAGTHEAPMFHAVMRMSRALVDAGVRHEVVPLPGEYHGYRGKALDYVLQATTDFFATHLNGEPSRLGALQGAVEAKPYGEWRSPVQAKDLAIGGTRYGELQADGDFLYWLEPIAAEGRTVVMRRGLSGAAETVTPPGFGVRTRVHEYGGGGLTVANGVVYFTHARDQQIWRHRPGEAPEALTRETGTRYANCTADPVRPRLVCVREDHRGEGEPRNALVAVALADGATSVLFDGTDFVSDPVFDAAGRRFAFLAWNHPHMPWDRVEVRVADVRADGALAGVRAINAGVDEAARTPRWARDGSLWFVGDRDGWWNFLRWDGRRVRAVTRERLEFGFAGWELGAETWDFLPDGRIVAAYNEAGDEGVALVDERDGRVQRLAADIVGARSLAVGSDRAWLEAGFRDRAHAIVELDPATGDAAVVRSPASPGFEAGASRAVALSYPTTDGMTAHAFYYPPANAEYRGPDGAKPPLVVIAHGGPTLHTTPAYNVGIHYWTSRGIAVLDLNYRGSTGFGRDYRRSLYGRRGEYDVQDAVQGARFVAAQGLADPERLLIRGNSAGGFIVLAALAFHDVFRAGANYFGVSDLETLRADTHKFESRYVETLIGPWPEARERYRQLSPIHNLDGLDRPLIVFQGLDDKVVPPNQSQRIVTALRARGVPVAYLEFAGEAHGFRQLKSNVEAREAELAFYGRVLGFRPAGELPAVRIDNLP
ncbi:MAG: prolyl oligopeptidase family serine peptidase, partial [Pseudomonadota bacterium]